MEWDDVRIFLTLLRADNLHGAGRRLQLDRSTISRRIAGLEQKLGVRLFVRTRNGLRPTPAAERLRPHAEHMELGAASLVGALKCEETQVAGVVRLATTEAFGTFLVMEGLLGLRDEYPDLVINLLAGNASVDLLRGEADIALRVAAVRHASLRVRCVQRSGVGLFAAPGYLRWRGTPHSTRALGGHDVLLPSGELAGLPEVQWLAKQTKIHVVFQTNSMIALVAAASAGLGIAPMPLLWGQNHPDLELAMVLRDIPERPVWLVTPAEQSNPAVRAVADRIVEICARKPSRPKIQRTPVDAGG